MDLLGKQTNVLNTPYATFQGPRVAGFTPFAAAWLIHRTRNDISPAYMIMAAAAISLVAVLSMKESYRAKLGV